MKSDQTPTAWTLKSILKTSSLGADELSRLRATLTAAPSLCPEGECEVIFDIGANKLISPDSKDFVGGLEGISKFSPGQKCVLGIAADVQIVGKGTMEWCFLDDKGNLKKIRGEGHCAPDSQLRLCSPQ